MSTSGLPAVGEYDAASRDELDIRAGDCVTVGKGPSDLVARRRFERDRVRHPLDETLWIDEEFVHDRRRRFDGEFLQDEFHDDFRARLEGARRRSASAASLSVATGDAQNASRYAATSATCSRSAL